MLMIKIRFTSATSLALLAALLAPLSGWAQSGGSKAQRLEWPRLLSGQPDFAFTRDEAFQDAVAKANREGGEMPKVYSLTNLIDDQTVFDPLGLNHQTVSATVAGLGEESQVSSTLQPLAVIDPLMANVMVLPSFNTSYTVDLGEFRASLVLTLNQTITNWRPPSNRFDFNDIGNGLTLQAVVTSPERYAVINGQRYAQGDTFQLQVPVTVPDMEIDAALQKRLPVSGTVSVEVSSQYQKAYEDVLGEFYKARSGKPSLGQQVVMVPVKVKAIQPRKVVLDIQGEEHVLQVRFAY